MVFAVFIMSVPFAPDHGLSESEGRIMNAVLSQLSGPIHHVVSQELVSFRDEMTTTIQNAISSAVESAVSRMIGSGGSSGSGIRPDSRSSLSSRSYHRSSSDSNHLSSSSGASDGFDASPLSSSTDESWKCPFCDAPLKDEHSFDEHLKKTLSKTSCESSRRRVVRKTAIQKRPYCVYDESDDDHRLLAGPWIIYGGYTHSWEPGYAMVRHIRSMLTPGARAVFNAGTGNRARVYSFVQSLRHGQVVIGQNVGSAPGGNAASGGDE